MRKFALITAVTLSLGAMAAGDGSGSPPGHGHGYGRGGHGGYAHGGYGHRGYGNRGYGNRATPTVAGIAVASGPALPSALASLAWRLAPSQPAPPAIPTTTMAMAVRPMGDPLTATATEPS